MRSVVGVNGMGSVTAVVVAVVLILHGQIGVAYKLGGKDGAGRSDGGTILVNRIDGCYHNGTVYGDGSMVPTVEPCLQCKCRDRNLVCSLRMCNEQPVPPPRGCVLVQKRGICCAYITCSKYHTLNELAERRRGDATHTITRRRSPPGTSAGPMDSQFKGGYSGNALFRGIDNEPDAVEGNAELCVYNGTVYKSGSAMTTSSLCSYCYCIGGRQKCVQPKCLLASPGCEPVYSDSTCCPIRYDCNVKNSSAAKPNFVHHSNKHYLRTKSRTQRSRGCLVGSHFYPEGQQLPVDPKEPCDMCFCIRGARKCTPKKCAPAIRNCRPMIPEGQCCPSSYECNHNEKIPNKSRQFDLFSLIFGDELENQTVTDTVPHDSTQKPVRVSTAAAPSTASDSLLAAIEAGLKYIESNDAKVGSLLDGHAQPSSNQSHPKQPLPVVSSSTGRPIIISTTTEREYSFLDIFLGDDDEEEEAGFQSIGHTLNATNTVEDLEQRTTHSGDTILSEETETTSTDSVSSSTSTDSLSTVDVTSNGSEISTLDESTIRVDSTTNQEGSTIMPDESSEIVFDESTTEELSSSSETESALSTSTTESSTIQDSTIIQDDSTTNVAGTAITSDSFKSNKVSETTHTPTTTQSPTPSSTNSFAQDLQELLSHSTRPKPNRTASLRPQRPIRPQIQQPMIRTPTRNSTDIKGTTENILSALFGGISNIFSETNETSGNINRYKIRFNNQTNGPIKRTTSPPRRTTTVAPTTPPITDIDTQPKTNKPLVTSPPLIVNSNPSILESDMNYDYGEPTLPPSLPNLNIIPFLPTDAVKNNPDRGGHFGAHSADQLDDATVEKESKSSSVHNDFELFHVSAKISGGSPDTEDGDGYNRNSYPSITEPNVDSHDAVYPGFSDHFQYDSYHPVEHRVNDYDPIKGAGFEATGHDESYGIMTSYDKNAFVGDEMEYKTSNPLFGVDRNNQFSPPSETEGGFLPKEPLLEDQYFFETYQKTKPMTSITTEVPANVNLHKDHPTVDAFSNALHTELPSDMYSSLNRNPLPVLQELFGHNSAIPLPDVDYDKDIISITTDSNYHSTSEYSSFSSAKPASIQPIQAITQRIPIYSPTAPTTTTTTTTVADTADLFGDFFGYLFKDDDELELTKNAVHEATIPPFKKITSVVSLHDILNMTNDNQTMNMDTTIEVTNSTTKTTEPTTEAIPTTTTPATEKPPVKTKPFVVRPVDQILKQTPSTSAPTTTTTIPTTTTTPTEPPLNLDILRDALLNTLTNADQHPVHPVRHPIYQGSVPFLSPIFQAKPPAPIEPKHPSPTEYNPIRSDLDLILSGIQQRHKEPVPFDPFNVNHLPSSNTLQSVALPEYSAPPPNRKDVASTVQSAQKFEGTAQIFTKPAPSVGLLKLAGCNIYGRMYRVGRIISELSSECLECKCTEVGVHCTPLDC